MANWHADLINNNKIKRTFYYLVLTAAAKVKIKMKLMKKVSKKVDISVWSMGYGVCGMEYAVHIGSGKVKISSVNKNILIIDDLLIKSIFLLPNYK